MRELSRKELERIIEKDLEPIYAVWDDHSDDPDVTPEIIYKGILKAAQKYPLSFKIAYQTYKSYNNKYLFHKKIGQQENYLIYLDLVTSISELI